MTTLSANDAHLKDLLKQAMLELLEERRDLFSEIFAEAIEEAGLVNAIREGQSTYAVSKKEVLKALGE
jgi:DNA-binding transcriptional ArsR family regulator